MLKFYNDFIIQPQEESGGGGGDNNYLNLTREVSAQGVYQYNTQDYVFTLPTEAKDLGNYALAYLTTGGGGLGTNQSAITTVDLSNLLAISGNYAMRYAFEKALKLTTADFKNVASISGTDALLYAFNGCTALISILFNNLETVSGVTALSNAFNGCTALTKIIFPKLKTISGNNAFSSAFYNCSNLEEAEITALETLTGSYALKEAFRGTKIKTLNFPALTSTSFGSITNPFNKMLSGVTGCTVHFPSNLQSVIGSWGDVASGFGGTNTNILYDLPATE